MTQVPAPVKLTVDPLIEAGTRARRGVDGEGDRIARTPAGGTHRVGAPTVGLVGGLEVKVMVWGPATIMNDCCTWGAAE